MSASAKSRRKILVAKFGSLFKRYPANKRCCIYCGLPAPLTVDHCPPLSSIDVLGVSYFDERGICFWLVLACVECNSVLGSVDDLHTLTDRKRHVAGFIAKRYEKALRGAEWSEDELAELGRGLRKYVKNHSDLHSVVKRRLAWSMGY